MRPRSPDASFPQNWTHRRLGQPQQRVHVRSRFRAGWRPRARRAAARHHDGRASSAPRVRRQRVLRPVPVEGMDRPTLAGATWKRADATVGRQRAGRVPRSTTITSAGTSTGRDLRRTGTAPTPSELNATLTRELGSGRRATLRPCRRRRPGHVVQPRRPRLRAGRRVRRAAAAGLERGPRRTWGCAWTDTRRSERASTRRSACRYQASSSLHLHASAQPRLPRADVHRALLHGPEQPRQSRSRRRARMVARRRRRVDPIRMDAVCNAVLAMGSTTSSTGRGQSATERWRSTNVRDVATQRLRRPRSTGAATRRYSVSTTASSMSTPPSST